MPSPSPDLLRWVREHANIVTVVEAYVRLLPAGKNYKALCPFHKEKTPSFFVNPEKGVWYCFGCQTGGDVIDFVQRIEGLTFSEAVARLAQQLGWRWQTPASLRREEWAKERLLQINRWATEFFERALWASEAGERARQYLFQRQISHATARRFRLGYAPLAWDALLKAATEADFASHDLFQAGLIQRTRDGSRYVDRFRDRLMFPITDSQGNVVGFGGRALGESEVKYLNTPETPLFQKRKCLYGLHLALPAIREKGEVILVEGYMDTIALHQGGFTNTVATLGTALNADTVQILRRYTQRVLIAYDSDSAGLNAVLRGADLFRQQEMEVRFVPLPEGSDPDSFLREQGALAFRQLLERAEPLVRFRVRWLVQRHPDATEEGLKDAVKVLSEFADPIEQRECLRLLAKVWSGDRPERMESLEVALTRALAEQRRRWASSLRPQSPPFPDPIRFTLTTVSPLPLGILTAEQELMAAMVQDREAAQKILAQMTPDEFLLAEHRDLARLVQGCLEEQGFADLPLLVAELGDEKLRQTLSGLMVRDLSFLKARNAIEDRILRLRRYRQMETLRWQQAELMRKISAGQLSPDDPLLKVWQENLRALKLSAR
jgi:DNA primase